MCNVYCVPCTVYCVMCTRMYPSQWYGRPLLVMGAVKLCCLLPGISGSYLLQYVNRQNEVGKLSVTKSLNYYRLEYRF